MKVWKVGALLALGVGGAVLACGGGENKNAASPDAPNGVRSTVIQHEDCNTSGKRVEKLDLTNDGKTDVQKVFDGQIEVCRITDLNHDGHPDLYEYFDKQGQIRRREYDFDDNTVVNQIDYYEGGKLVRREADTTNQGKIDTWDYFDPNTGARTKRERDATGDGRIDQWWTYEGDPQNPKITIAMDRNGDGLPDPDSTLVLGAPAGAAAVSDGGPSAVSDAAAAPPPPPPPPASSSGPSLSPVAAPDAGPAKRGGAKR